MSDVRIERVAARPDEYELDTTDFDVVPLSDEAAAPICARHDEIGTNRPVFVGQDKVKRYALSERERERCTGTPWYREWPQRLLQTEYHRWRTSRGCLGQRGPGVVGREVVFAAIEAAHSRRRSTSAGRALAMKGRTSTPRRRPAEQRAAGQVPALPMNNTLRSSGRRKLAGFLPLRFTAHFGARRECLLRSGSLRPERRVGWRIIPAAYASLGRTSQVRTAGVIVTTPPARHRHQALRTARR
ncbi:MAG: hypothetical protein JNL18_08475 [Planctomycetaceae bacterium]|nr:hypothetical protein [Planctomycetaceae bacterium]